MLKRLTTPIAALSLAVIVVASAGAGAVAQRPIAVGPAAEAVVVNTVTVSDPRGDIKLIDGSPGRESSSVDISRVSFEKDGQGLRVTVFIKERMGFGQGVIQYVGVDVLNPKSGIKYLMQWSRATGFELAQQSWNNELSCPNGQGSDRFPDRVVIRVPRTCLNNPGRLSGLYAMTVAEREITPGYFYSVDEARTSKVLRLR